MSSDLIPFVSFTHQIPTILAVQLTLKHIRDVPVSGFVPSLSLAWNTSFWSLCSSLPIHVFGKALSFQWGILWPLYLNLFYSPHTLNLSYGASSVALVVRDLPARAGDSGFDPGLGRSPGGGNGNPIPEFSPQKLHGQRSLAGYSSWGGKESGVTEHTNTHILLYSSFRSTYYALTFSIIYSYQNILNVVSKHPRRCFAADLYVVLTIVLRTKKKCLLVERLDWKITMLKDIPSGFTQMCVFVLSHVQLSMTP